MSQAELDLKAALARLQKGAPRNQQLKMLASKGRLRITVSSVALEAGRSRTLIGTKECAYPEIRRRILDMQVPSNHQRKTHHEMIAQLRRENDVLKKENARIATQLADAVATAWRLKKELEFQKAVQKKSRKASGNVVLFRPSGE